MRRAPLPDRAAIRWSGHNVGPSVFVWRVRSLVILPRRGLESDRDDRAGRTELAVKEFVEIEVALICRTDGAGENLLGIPPRRVRFPPEILRVTHRTLFALGPRF